MIFSTEDRLLFQCLRVDRDPQAEHTLRRMLAQPLHWKSLFRTAMQSDIAPMLRQSLGRCEEKVVPDWVKRELDRVYHRVGYQNARYYVELVRLLKVFKTNNIDVIVLKGAALAETVWGNIALRRMGDIDLLVREGDLDASEQTLLDMGYVPRETVYSIEHFRRESHHLVPYWKQDPFIIVEIHRNIVSSNNVFPVVFDVRKLWDRAWEVTLGEVRTRILSPEDTIMHLCLHQCLHDPSGGKVKSLMDLSRLIDVRAGEIRWDQILEESEERGIGSFLYYPLFFAHDLLGARVPESVLQRLRKTFSRMPFEDRVVKGIVRRLVLIRDAGFPIFHPSLLQEVCLDLLKNANSREKVCALLKSLFVPPKDSRTHTAGIQAPLNERVMYPLRRIAKFTWRALRMSVTKGADQREVADLPNHL